MGKCVLEVQTRRSYTDTALQTQHGRALPSFRRRKQTPRWRRSVEQSGAAATASGSASTGAVDADDEAANAVSEPVISVGPHLEEGLAEAFEEQ